jgi:hypothetical protein
MDGVPELVDVHFTMNLKDYSSATWQILRYDVNFWLVLATAVAAGIFSIRQLTVGESSGFSLGIATVLGLITFRRLFVLPAQRYQRQQIGLNHYSYRFSATGIAGSIQDARSEWSWRLVVRVREATGFLLIYALGPTVLLVPKRAIGDQAHIDALVSLIRSRIKASRAASSPSQL